MSMYNTYNIFVPWKRESSLSESAVSPAPLLERVLHVGGPPEVNVCRKALPWMSSVVTPSRIQSRPELCQIIRAIGLSPMASQGAAPSDAASGPSPWPDGTHVAALLGTGASQRSWGQQRRPLKQNHRQQGVSLVAGGLGSRGNAGWPSVSPLPALACLLDVCQLCLIGLYLARAAGSGVFPGSSYANSIRASIRQGNLHPSAWSLCAIEIAMTS